MLVQQNRPVNRDMATAIHQNGAGDSSQVIEQMTQDRFATWHAFTKATTAGVIFMVVLLVGMAIFLL